MADTHPVVDVDYENNLLAAGAVMMMLQSSAWSLDSVEPVVGAGGVATNQLIISMSFMRSPYRITVERVAD